ncbi:unnamed protein product [Timema podura]|uniref:Uncharacterized protein n=1 Tax=Timema podura TaxID=61482 RepID=A0ABN7NNM7_TIMPD|nr:unnamed protein product [Timema podura]
MSWCVLVCWCSALPSSNSDTGTTILADKAVSIVGILDCRDNESVLRVRLSNDCNCVEDEDENVRVEFWSCKYTRIEKCEESCCALGNAAIEGQWEASASILEELGQKKANSLLENFHPTEIRTSISPSSAVGLNTTSALANYATEAGKEDIN